MNRIVLLLLIIWSSFCIYTKDESILQGTEAFSGALLVVFIGMLSGIVNSFFKKRKKSSSIKIITFFLLSYSIAHFQAYLDFSLGFLNENNDFIWQGWSSIYKSAYLSAAVFCGFLLGYSYKFKSLENVSNKTIKLGFIPILIPVLLVSFIVLVDKSYIFGGYGDKSLGYIDGLIALILECSFIAHLIIDIYNSFNTSKGFKFFKYVHTNRFFFVQLGIYLLLVLISGDRGPIIFFGLSLILHFVLITKKQFGYIFLTLLIFYASALVTTLGIIRSTDKDLSKIFTLTTESRKYDKYPRSFSMGTKELAGSVRALHIAVDAVPKKIPHTLGFLTIQEFFLIVPFLKGAIIDIFGIPRFLTSSAQLLTFIDLGPNATWGVGTSCVADAFINFGSIGSIIVFILFGVFIRYLDKIIETKSVKNVYVLIPVILYFSYSIYIPRATLIYPLSKFLIISLIIYASQMIRRSDILKIASK